MLHYRLPPAGGQNPGRRRLVKYPPNYQVLDNVADDIRGPNTVLGNDRRDVLQVKDAWYRAITMPSCFTRQRMWFQAQLLQHCLLSCMSFLRPAKSENPPFFRSPIKVYC